MSDLETYSNGLKTAHEIQTCRELAEYRQTFYTWHENTHAIKINSMQVAFDLVDNLQNFVIFSAIKGSITKKLKTALDLHLVYKPGTLHTDATIALIGQTTGAFKLLESNYRDIKQVIQFKESAQLEKEKKAVEEKIELEQETKIVVKQSDEPFVPSTVATLIKKFDVKIVRAISEEPKHRRRASSMSGEEMPTLERTPKADPRMQRLITSSKLTTHYRTKHPKPDTTEPLPSILEAATIDKTRRVSGSLKK